MSVEDVYAKGAGFPKPKGSSEEKVPDKEVDPLERLIKDKRNLAAAKGYGELGEERQQPSVSEQFKEIAQVGKDTFQAGRDMSKDEREARKEAEGKIEAAKQKAEDERDKRLQIQFDSTLSEVRHAVEKMQDSMSGAKKDSPTFTQSLTELVTAIGTLEQFRKQYLGKPEDENKPASGIDMLRQVKEQYDLLKDMFSPQGTLPPPMVEGLPASIYIDKYRIDIEDKRERELTEKRLTVEERKGKAYRGLLATIASAASQIAAGIEAGEAAPKSLGRGNTAGNPRFTEVVCKGCERKFYIDESDETGVTGCPFCGSVGEERSGA